jgi:hypothetical protein
MVRRAFAACVVGAGFLIILAARLVVPSAPPLYDGIVPIEPYVWLNPPPGAHGGAKGARAEIPVQGGSSPLVAVATPELEPQAQVFAEPGALTMPASANTVRVSIEPVPPEAAPTEGHIDGNAYRINVTDEHGTPLTAPASARVSVLLRTTSAAQAQATMARFSGGSWVPLKTSSSGFGGSFISVVTEFGDFAMIVPGQGPSATATGAPTMASGGSIEASGGSIEAFVPSAAPPGRSPAPNASSPHDGLQGSPDWTLLALVLLAIAIAVLGLDLARRRRRDRYR